MSERKGLSDGAKITLILGAMVVVVLVGSLLNRRPAPTTPDTPAVSEAPDVANAAAETVAPADVTPDEPVVTAQVPVATATAGSGFEPTVVRLLDTVAVPGVKRLGMNLGAPEPYGAGNFLKNLIHNPGFEPGMFRSMMHVEKGATGTRVPQAFWTTEWDVEEWGIGQNPGFWKGADIEFVYGPAKGRKGRVSDYRYEGQEHVFYIEPEGSAPKQWDVFIVRKDMPGYPGPYAMNEALVSKGEVRPGSPGVQSLHLQNPAGEGAAEWRYFMDSTYRDDDPSAGKLYLVEGAWRLKFWARGGKDGDTLSIDFSREGEAQFFNESIALTKAWKEYTFEFEVPQGADALREYGDAYKPILVFQMTLWDAGAEAWVDDMYLGRSDYANPTVFADPLVDALKQLQPGVLRKWAGQLGASLDNELAEPFARKTYEHNPRGRKASGYAYSLHEFLELCALLKCEPWYVVPPTFTADECANLIAYFAAPADANDPYAARRAALGQREPWTTVFPTIHLEFGNEMWGEATPNDPFYGGSAMGGERLAQIASDRFGIMKASPYYSADQFDCIIGGQASWPGRQEEIDRNGTHHDTIAIAPYFGGLDDYATPEQIYPPLFAYAEFASKKGVVNGMMEALQSVGKGTGAAIYEINYHTTGGPAPEDIRNRFVAGDSGAVSLPLCMLVYLRDHGIRAQCVFTLLQYSFAIGEEDHVRLWGVMRDLFATGRVRPTGLGLTLVNHAIMGDMLTTQHEGQNPGWEQGVINGIEEKTRVPYLYSFAFRDGDETAIILFNLHLTESVPVQVAFEGAGGKADVETIAPASIDAWNEDAEAVQIEHSTIEDFQTGHSMALPPHSLTSIRWKGQ